MPPTIQKGPELELLCEIWNEHGDHFEIGPDRDGLDMIEIREYVQGTEKDDKCINRVVFTKDTARLMITALTKVLENNPDA